MGQLTFQATLGGAVNLAGPNTASTTTFTLPAADGTSGQFLSTNGSGTLSFATPTAGASVSAANTWTATQTFNGSSSTFGTVLLDSAETVNVVGSAPSATTNYYVQSGSVQYYTSNAAKRDHESWVQLKPNKQAPSKGHSGARCSSLDPHVRMSEPFVYTKKLHTNQQVNTWASKQPSTQPA